MPFIFNLILVVNILNFLLNYSLIIFDKYYNIKKKAGIFRCSEICNSILDVIYYLQNFTSFE